MYSSLAFNYIISLTQLTYKSIYLHLGCNHVIFTYYATWGAYVYDAQIVQISHWVSCRLSLTTAMHCCRSSSYCGMFRISETKRETLGTVINQEITPEFALASCQRFSIALCVFKYMFLFESISCETHADPHICTVQPSTGWREKILEMRAAGDRKSVIPAVKFHSFQRIFS